MTTRFDSALSFRLSNGVVLNVAPATKNMDVPSIDLARASLDDWTGSSIWESGEGLARLLSAQPARVRGKKVLELGCGCALVGLAAGALGARQVTLTDQVLFMAAHNLEANFAGRPELRTRFQLLHMEWGNVAEAQAADPPYDVILAADLMYDQACHGVLAETIISLSAPGTVVLLAAPDGSPDDPDGFGQQLYRPLRSHGFCIRDISAHRAVAKALGASGVWGMYGRGPVRVVEMHLPPTAPARL